MSHMSLKQAKPLQQHNTSALQKPEPQWAGTWVPDPLADLPAVDKSSGLAAAESNK